MLSKELKPLIAYRITKGSTDTTLQTNDIIWISEKQHLNIADPKYPGWLDPEEWSHPPTNDFEAEIAPDYEIIRICHTEICKKKTNKNTKKIATNLYHMKIVFSLSISNPLLNQITEQIDGSHPIIKNAAEIAIEQTIPFIPTKAILQQYADIIKEKYESSNKHIDNVQFIRYDFIEPITINDESKPTKMSVERAKQLLFCVLQLIRQYREKQGFDPNDTDDLLFSELDMEISEVEEIYEPYKDSVNTSSCFKNNESPKDFDRKYFDT